MAEGSAGGYRDKYFQALEDQERLEKQTAMQLELMKKTLLSLGVAASGMDQSLDASVMRLRELMRGASGAQVVEQIDRVQATVENFERSRSGENQKAAKSMSLLIEQYLELQLPADLKTSLTSFSKSLKTRLTNYRQYPAALEDLSKLQLLALTSASNPKLGLWTRIKGGHTINMENASQPEPQLSPQTENPDAQVGSDISGQINNDGDRNDSQPEPYAPRELSLDSEPKSDVMRVSGAPQWSGQASDEDSYEQVSARIASTLANLVDKIEPNDVIRHRVDIVRHRIDRGMDWYVLAVTLEDIRDILFLRYLQADEEFSVYLNQVREELGSIRNSLDSAVQDDEEQQEATTALTERVSNGVGRIQKSVAGTDQISVLKQEVVEHISYISDALSEFKTQRTDSLTERLKSLVTQVQSVEKESQRTKEALEEQRHKATHDPLTGLPNREAYADRSFQEMQRFKRYCRPLTVAICDLDLFKKINDGFGHAAGDKVLKLIAKVVSTRLRKVDFIARYGGEEFVILMPETTTEQAFSVLDKIRAEVGKTPFRFKESPVQITISFGLSGFRPEDTLEHAFERADQALYKAKADGRNRCVISPELQAPD